MPIPISDITNSIPRFSDLPTAMRQARLRELARASFIRMQFANERDRLSVARRASESSHALGSRASDEARGVGIGARSTHLPSGVAAHQWRMARYSGGACAAHSKTANPRTTRQPAKLDASRSARSKLCSGCSATPAALAAATAEAVDDEGDRGESTGVAGRPMTPPDWGAQASIGYCHG